MRNEGIEIKRMLQCILIVEMEWPGKFYWNLKNGPNGSKIARLETGIKQPEAIAVYKKSGYSLIVTTIRTQVISTASACKNRCSDFKFESLHKAYPLKMKI
jgi:hypothetical protein